MKMTAFEDFPAIKPELFKGIDTQLALICSAGARLKRSRGCFKINLKLLLKVQFLFSVL